MKMINRILKIFLILFSLSYFFFTGINLTRILKGKSLTLNNMVQDIKTTKNLHEIQNKKFSFKSVQGQKIPNVNYYNGLNDNSIFSSLSNLLDNIGKEVTFKKSCPEDDPVPTDFDKPKLKIEKSNNNCTISNVNTNPSPKYEPIIDNNSEEPGITRILNNTINPGRNNSTIKFPIIRCTGGNVVVDQGDSEKVEIRERPSPVIQKNETIPDDNTEIKIKMLIDEQIKTSKIIQRAIKHIEKCQSNCNSRQEENPNYGKNIRSGSTISNVVNPNGINSNPNFPSGISQRVNNPDVGNPIPIKSEDDNNPDPGQSTQENNDVNPDDNNSDEDQMDNDNQQNNDSDENIQNKNYQSSQLPSGANSPDPIQAGQNIPNTNGQGQNNVNPRTQNLNFQDGNIPYSNLPVGNNINGNNQGGSNANSNQIPKVSNPNLPRVNNPNPNKPGKIQNPNKQTGKASNPNKLAVKSKTPNKSAVKNLPKAKINPKNPNKSKSKTDKKNQPIKQKSTKTDSKKKSEKKNKNKNQQNKLPNPQYPPNSQQQYPPQNYNNYSNPYNPSYLPQIQQEQTDDEDCSAQNDLSQSFNLDGVMKCFSNDPDIQIQYWQSEIANSEYKDHFLSSSTFCYICCENEIKDENILLCCKQRCDYIKQGFNMSQQCSNYFNFS